MSGIQLSFPVKASSAVQVCIDTEGPVVRDSDKQPVQQRRQEMILMLQICHLKIGSHYLNMEQDSFILKPNVRNFQLVSKPVRGKRQRLYPSFL